MDKQESTVELEVIKELQHSTHVFFENVYDYEKNEIEGVNFDLLESMIYSVIQRTLNLKGFRNRFWGIAIKHDLQSLYLKAYQAKIIE